MNEKSDSTLKDVIFKATTLLGSSTVYYALTKTPGITIVKNGTVSVSGTDKNNVYSQLGELLCRLGGESIREHVMPVVAK